MYSHLENVNQGEVPELQMTMNADIFLGKPSAASSEFSGKL